MNLFEMDPNRIVISWLKRNKDAWLWNSHCSYWYLTREGKSQVKVTKNNSRSIQDQWYTQSSGASLWLRWQRTCLWMQKNQVQSLGGEDALENEMATHSILAWEISWSVTHSHHLSWSCNSILKEGCLRARLYSVSVQVCGFEYCISFSPVILKHFGLKIPSDFCLKEGILSLALNTISCFPWNDKLTPCISESLCHTIQQWLTIACQSSFRLE